MCIYEDIQRGYGRSVLKKHKEETKFKMRFKLSHKCYFRHLKFISNTQDNLYIIF